MIERGSLEAAHARVLALYDAGMHMRALSQTEEALASYPDDAWLHAVRADLLGHVGRHDEAVLAARHAISLDPDDGYAHEVLANALSDTNAKQELVVEAASEAVRLDPTPQAYYTLVRAFIYQRHGVPRAAEVARALGEQHPDSVLAPLALALVAMRRSGMLGTYRWWWIVIAIVITQGTALLIYAVVWIVDAIRRVPHLKEADQHLRRALAMDPNSPTAQLLAAEVFRARYRYGQAVDQQVAVGALNARLVDAREVVARIARRITWAVVVACVVWAIPGYLFYDHLAGAITAPVTAALLAVLVFELRRRQARALPRALRSQLDRQTTPMAVIVAAAVLVAATSWVVSEPGSWYRNSALLSAAVAFAVALAAAGVWIRVRLPAS